MIVAGCFRCFTFGALLGLAWIGPLLVSAVPPAADPLPIGRVNH
jgi:hypothetical protein